MGELYGVGKELGGRICSLFCTLSSLNYLFTK